MSDTTGIVRFLKDSVVSGFPSQWGARHQIFEWLVARLDAARKYSEKEITHQLALLCVARDPVTLRRDLIDHRYLKRDRYGKEYWVNPAKIKP